MVGLGMMEYQDVFGNALGKLFIRLPPAMFICSLLTAKGIY